MDERARAIFDEARATLHRVRNVTVEHNRDHSVEYWERPKPPNSVSRFTEPHQPSVAEIEMLRSQDWARFVDGRISAALDEHDERWRAILGGLVSEIRKQLRGEFQEQLGLLRADVEIQRKAAERGEADVIDLPNPLMRSRRA